MLPQREGLGERRSLGPEGASTLFSSGDETWVINCSIREISAEHENVVSR